jgi:hypothetical protein
MLTAEPLTVERNSQMNGTAVARRAMVWVMSRPVAAWEYYFRPELHDPFGGAFNGQRARQAAFLEVIQLLQVNAIIETGTFRGSTTQFIAEHTTEPIWTVEARLRFYHFARLRLARFHHVHISFNDSRTFLQRLAADSTVPKRGVFFYLDAHWYEDLPLRDEIKIVTRHWSEIAIMVDDFQVPNDSDYKFDDYGGDRKLCLQYLGPLSQYGLQAFFPSVSATDETGMRRGSVVLGDSLGAKHLAKARTLRPA